MRFYYAAKVDPAMVIGTTIYLDTLGEDAWSVTDVEDNGESEPGVTFVLERP